ncbi:MAG: sigma-70 family RNA polymerase sigma factor [Planctomycetota bacterium]
MPTLPTLSVEERAVLARQHEGLVRAVAWEMRQKLPPHVDIEELVAFGMLGLAQAISRYDPSNTAAFATYAFYRVRGEILDGLRRMSWFYEAAYEGRVYADESNQDWESSDRSATVGIPRRHCSRRSIEAAEVQQSQDAYKDGQLDAIFLKERLQIALRELAPDERELLRLTYADGLSLAKAAERLGLSRSWACRLHQRILEQLAAKLA